MNCPKCNQFMTEVHKDSVNIDVCTNCKGIFLDRGELERIIMESGYSYPSNQPNNNYNDTQNQPYYPNQPNQHQYNNHHHNNYNQYDYKMAKKMKEAEFKKKHPVMHLLKDLLD